MDVCGNIIKFSNRQLDIIKMLYNNNDYISIKINTLELCATTWMNLTKTMLSKKTQAQKQIHCIIPFT